MIKKKYRIAYASGSRADYGIVKKYLSYLKQDDEIDFSILVTGSHLDSVFGSTVSIIEADGFKIDLKVDLHINTKSTASILESMSIGINQFGQHFEENKYDLLIVLGDRYEMFSVVQAAAMQKIPILHLHGGEITYGNYDEFIRHCITKMSHFHFASTESYRKRIIQMGEHPDTVFNMGSLGAENCTNIDENSVFQEIRNLSARKYFVIAFHPETLTNINLEQQVENLINALQNFSNQYAFVLIGTNADTNSEIIREKWIDFSKQDDVYYFENLNTDSYLYLVKHSVALIGNSSSGIIEAPSLGVYSINIGNRQKGRIHGNSVIDVICDEAPIKEAIQNIIHCKTVNTHFINPYYQGNEAERYYKKTKQLITNTIISPKEFYDLN